MKSVTTTTIGLDLVNQLKPVQFNYANSTTTLYGFVPEEVANLSPSLVTMDESGKITGVNYDQMMPLMVSSVKQLSVKVDEIDERLTDLETIIAEGGYSSGNGGVGFEAILTGLEDLGAKFMNGVAYLKQVFTENLTVGTSEKPSGITLYDEVTGDPYCLKMSNGAMVSTAGECSVVSQSGGGNGEDTSSPVITVVGNNPATITSGSSYNDLGATVTDTNTDGSVNNNLGLHFSVDGVDMPDVYIDTSLSTSSPQATTTHTIIYSSVDGAGNWGYATRTVDVIPQ
jgi:hypothetical protein